MRDVGKALEFVSAPRSEKGGSGRPVGWLAACALVASTGCGLASNSASVDAVSPGSPGSASSAESRLHLLIPGDPGGGWDGTARGVGLALRRSGLVGAVSYENMTGGGGGRALAHLVATAGRQRETLMVSSTPIVLRSVRGRLPQTYRDVTPVVGLIGDYLGVVVRADSTFQTLSDLLGRFDEDPRSVSFAGGSVLGGMDHLVAAMFLQRSGRSPSELLYVPYQAGGKAMAGLLAGETTALITGLGEAMSALDGDLVRVLALGSPERVATHSHIPTFREQGTDFVFVNWRGFFGPPGLDSSRLSDYERLFDDLVTRPEWKEIVARSGWVEMFRQHDEFERFLGDQEIALRELLEIFAEEST